jgi:hypothetical protein
MLPVGGKQMENEVTLSLIPFTIRLVWWIISYVNSNGHGLHRHLLKQYSGCIHDNSTLGVSMMVFLDKVNIWIYRVNQIALPIMVAFV